MRRQIRACGDARDREVKVAQEDFLVAESYRAVEEELRNEAITSAATSPDSDVWASKPPWYDRCGNTDCVFRSSLLALGTGRVQLS